MLRYLRVENLAVVREIAIEFGPGLTALTGETGAGKSILVDALMLLLGARASTDLLRTGSELAQVEGIFRVADNPAVRAILESIGDLPEDDELVIRRELTGAGRSRAFVNGRLQPLAVLRDLGRTLADVHGQHDHMRLLDPSTHIDVLDHHAGLDRERVRLAEAHANMRDIGARLQHLRDTDSERRRRADFLRFELSEIGDAKLEVGEEEELLRERAQLLHRGRLLELAEGAYQALYEAESSVLDRLSAIERQLQELGSYDSSLGSPDQQVKNARVALSDLALELRDYARNLPDEVGRLDGIELRRERIERLKLKYGPSVSDVIVFAADGARELATLEVSAEEREQLEAELALAEANFAEIAEVMSERRREAAGELERGVVAELAELAMEKAVFRVRIEKAEDATSSMVWRERRLRFDVSGFDRVEFDFSANLGEEPRPLTRVASGGELSRLMLALRVAADSHEPGRIDVFHGLESGLGARVAVFDEVDAGIGGQVAHVLGRKLRCLAAGRQVLCVTHLPAVAAAADHHVGVRKQETDGRTEVVIEPLEGAPRVQEISRMLAGDAVTPTVRRHAGELLERMAR